MWSKSETIIVCNTHSRISLFRICEELIRSHQKIQKFKDDSNSKPLIEQRTADGKMQNHENDA